MIERGHWVQETSIKVKGDLIGELSFIFRVRHIYTACVGKAPATLFALGHDDYQQICSTYVEDASKVTDEVIHGADGSGAHGKSQASAGSTTSASLEASSAAKQRVEDAIRRQTEAQVVALIDAAAVNDSKAVSKILDSGKLDVDESNYDCRTAAHVAATIGNKEIAKLILGKYQGTVNVKDRYDATPLDDAIRKEHFHVLEVLQTFSSQPIQATDAYIQMMIQAAADDNLGLVQILRAAGLQPNCYDMDSRTPLHLAVSCKSSSVLDYLISLPEIELSPVDRMGNTPLWDALTSEDAESAQKLRKAGAVVQDDISAHLCYAAAANDVKFFDLLLSVKMDVFTPVRFS